MKTVQSKSLPRPPATSDVAARLVDATKQYVSGETVICALDGVSVSFAARQFTAIMGPSGSGKSTLLNCAAALDTLDSGEAWIGDVSLVGLDDRQLTRLRGERIGMVFQAFNLLDTLTAEENIRLPHELAGRRVDRHRLNEIVAAVGLADRLDHRPAQLSGGQQQRVAVARALLGRPEILFADEPTGNLDLRSRNEILGLLRQATDVFDQTVLMVTHDSAAAMVADRVLVLADGRIVADINSPTLELVTAALAAASDSPRQLESERGFPAPVGQEALRRTAWMARGRS